MTTVEDCMVWKFQLDCPALGVLSIEDFSDVAEGTAVSLDAAQISITKEFNAVIRKATGRNLSQMFALLADDRRVDFDLMKFVSGTTSFPVPADVIIVEFEGELYRSVGELKPPPSVFREDSLCHIVRTAAGDLRYLPVDRARYHAIGMIGKLLAWTEIIEDELRIAKNVRTVSRRLLRLENNEFDYLLDFFVGHTDLVKLALTPKSVKVIGSDHLAWLGDAVASFLLAVAGLQNDSLRSRFRTNLPNEWFAASSFRIFGECSEGAPQTMKGLLGASLAYGGIECAVTTVREFGLLESDPSPCAQVIEFKRFFRSVVVPAVIKLEMTLLLFRSSNANRITVKELHCAREQLIACAQKTDLTAYSLFRFCVLDHLGWLKLVS